MMDGKDCDGITACSVISPDLQIEYGSTGSVLVWELFDSIAYVAEKFAAMLDRARERFEREQEILNDDSLADKQRARAMRDLRRKIRMAVSREGAFHLPPRGFSVMAPSNCLS